MTKLTRKRFLLVPMALPSALLLSPHGGTSPAWGQTRVYPRIDAAFELPGLTGDPFDYTENDVQVTFQGPDTKTVRVPAFFDGGTTWRVRYAPLRPGTYRLKNVTRNGTALSVASVSGKAYKVAGSTAPGFVRRDAKDATRLIFENGAPYYPIGHNVAWKGSNAPDIPQIFAKMKGVGENWSRVWMNHWDGKNLDWPPPPAGKGRLNLDAARRWDTIVEAAEKNGIYFQMTLQHHGQYSSTVNPNWEENPWNTKNGGFLQKPEEFFTNAEAKKRTKAKYRYIVARWGYSPHILAWELFNEVQFTDAARAKQYGIVAAWHKEMAAFLRQHDPNKHLVTTSSDLDIPGLYDVMDYVQPHAYQPDAVTTVTGITPWSWKKPIFYGEIGPSGDLDKDDGTFLHEMLWASVMSESSGTAQYWAWDNVDRRNLYGLFAPVSAFLKATNLASHHGLRTIIPGVETKEKGSILFGPGAGWGAGQQKTFPISASGTVEGAGTMPAFLQGTNHPELFTHAEFPVEYAQPGTFAVQVKQAAKAGAKLVIKVDGVISAEHTFPAAAQDTNTDIVVEVKVPAGKHVVRLENTGQDWLVVQRITLAPYGPTLRVVAKASPDTAALWVRNTKPGNATPGTLTLPDLKPGKYRILWWDTRSGKPISEGMINVANGGVLMVKTPAIMKDAAVFVSRLL
jgi:hypothetical protein